MSDATHGHGHAIGHHGEILQGIFQGKQGGRQRGLVTLPCPRLVTHARYESAIETTLSISPETSEKALKAAKLTLEHLHMSHLGGLITTNTNIPKGFGMGSSTADVVATIRAVVKALGKELQPLEVAAIAIAAEAAIDPLMMTQEAVLFAHRDGEIIERMGPQLPPMMILGVNTAPGETIDTLSHPPADYDQAAFEEFERLRERLWTAIKDGDVDGIGSVATRSARINQAFLPKPRFADLIALAPEIGAVGVQVAHSGTVAGFIFDVMSPEAARPDLTAVLERNGFAPSFTFVTGGY